MFEPARSRETLVADREGQRPKTEGEEEWARGLLRRNWPGWMASAWSGLPDGGRTWGRSGVCRSEVRVCCLNLAQEVGAENGKLKSAMAANSSLRERQGKLGR